MDFFFADAQPKPLFARNVGFWNTLADEQKQGFFEKLTPSQSQRENWYVVIPYIAEFWCTISNFGLLGVGVYHQSPELICAATASITSHTVPKQCCCTLIRLQH